MSEFHDPELRQQLGRLSGPYPDDNLAFAAWQRRVGQARRRRAVAWTTAAALSLVMATVGVAALQSPGRQGVVPGESSETSAEVSLSVATTEADDTSSTESTVAETMAPVAEPLETTPSSEVVDTSVPETESGDAAGSGEPSGSSKNHGGSPTTPPTAAPQPQTATKTVPSIGGSITVVQDGDKLTITSIIPAAGFKANESDHSGRRVGVTFSSGTHSSEITVRLSDGVIKESVTENDNHEESIPDSSGGDHSDGDNG